MIQVTPQTRIFVAVEPADFRKGIDGLCRVCRELRVDDPLSGALFVFRNRRATALKILAYDGQGFWLCQKRLSQGKFQYWPKSERADLALKPLVAHELHVLLAGGDRSTSAPHPLNDVTPVSGLICHRCFRLHTPSHSPYRRRTPRGPQASGPSSLGP